MLVREDFHPLPRPTEADQAEDAIYSAVGRALSQWELFEEELALRFSDLMNASPYDMAVRLAYGSIISFNGRRDMLVAAAEGHFAKRPSGDGKIEDRFKSFVRNVCSDAASRRNEIAHGVVIYKKPFSGKGFPTHMFPNGGYILGPAEYATNRRSKPFGEAKYLLSSVEINSLGRKFGVLRQMAETVLRADEWPPTSA